MQKIRILYAEDYDLLLFTVRSLLESENWAVEVCRDGRAALNKIEDGESYDLLILDQSLRDVSGIELIGRARRSERLRATPIVMFTAAPCEEEARAAGADAYLTKPGGLKDLIGTCRALLRPGGGEAWRAGTTGTANEAVN